VVLLDDQYRNHFSVEGSEIEGIQTLTHRQRCKAELAVVTLLHYDVKINFTGGIDGSFRQRVAFDFGNQSVYYTTVRVELWSPTAGTDLREKMLSERQHLAHERYVIR
jgi:hypothetical protein